MHKSRMVPMMVAAGLMGLPYAANAQDAAAGKTAFAQCQACHAVDGKNGVGPSLGGVIGRKAGSVTGFRYSRAMKDSTVKWDDKNLDAYIANPQAVIPGNLMPFSGVPDAKQRSDLVAYLKTAK